MRPNPNTWNNSTEKKAIYNLDVGTPESRLVQEQAVQAERFAKGEDLGRDKVAQQKRAMLMKAFISQGHVELVTNARDRLNAASFIVRNDPHFIPDSILPEAQAAFIVALAEELSKPEYNQ